MYLLDTNIISESRKLGTSRIDPNAARWFAEVDAETSFISAMTVFELERGVAQTEHRDAKQGAALRQWLDGQSFERHTNTAHCRCRKKWR